MTHVLIAIPYEPERGIIWPNKAQVLARRLMDATPDVAFTLALHAAPRTSEPGDGRFSANARARNGLLAACLRPEHTHVLWVDSDLEDYPADLVTRLLALNPHGISAPAVLLDGPLGPNRFYDILGFIEAGHAAHVYQPWFTQRGPVIDLDSVGCIYLAPAALYRQGARYENTIGYTEHWPVMAAARAAGLRVCADLSLEALHAWLPYYGEAAH